MKQPVSLVLSSGGARGVAHIGVIEELERQGFEIRSIAGSSISIPTVLIPFMLDEMVLIDGGVVNPLPINRVKRSEHDLLIAVDLNANSSTDEESAGKRPSEEEETESALWSFIREKGIRFFPKTPETHLNYYSLLTQSVSLMTRQITALTIEMHQPDILISIPKDAFGTFDFHKSEEIIKAGEMAAKKALENQI